MNYIDVCKIFEERGCKLLDTETDINNKKYLTKKKTLHHVNVSFIATCGHINNVIITNFKLRGTGIICNECIQNKTGLILKEKNKITCVTEYNGYVYIKNILEGHFEIKRTPEGCEADIIIRPIYNQDDKWLKLQLKTTINKVHNMYSFSILPYKYNDDMVFLCICEKDNKVWCVEHHDVKHLKYKMNISNKSKYNKYELSNHSLTEKLIEIYQTYLEFKLLSTYQKSISPKNIYQQREQEYIKIRESLLPEWNFKYNSVEGLSYDFIIHNKRVQEKVSNSKKKENIYNICLKRNSSVHNYSGKRNMKPYEKHDFDILWVHLQDIGIFYVIPMNELINHKFIKTDTYKGKCSIILSIINKDTWYSKYQFKNDNFDIDALLEIFQK